MQPPNVFIISRRAWEQDDLEYGTFEVIFVTLKDYLADKTFRDLRLNALNSPEVECFDETNNTFEYKRNKWFYQYKIEGFIRDTLCAKKK